MDFDNTFAIMDMLTKQFAMMDILITLNSVMIIIAVYRIVRKDNL